MVAFVLETCVLLNVKPTTHRDDATKENMVPAC